MRSLPILILAVAAFAQEGKPPAVSSPKLAELCSINDVKKGFHGNVLLRVQLDERGAPQRATVLRSLRKDFDQAAIDAVMAWEPVMKNGKPVTGTLSVEAGFDCRKVLLTVPDSSSEKH